MNAPLLLTVALLVLSVPVAACAAYLFCLTLLSSRPRPPAARTSKLGMRFAVVVPAHNEERNVAATVQSLSALDYPNELRTIVVVADNCTDQTADAARAAGATVLERKDESKRGKGYALSYAFERLVGERTADVAVVVDADTEASGNLLHALASRFEAGASCVQVRYGVRNRDASWRTRLMAIGFAMFHDLRSLAREKMRVSCGLRGNGMAFRLDLLAKVPHDAYSIVEDVEYGISLGKLGHRVWYVDEACVLGEMVATEKESRSQRRRWEGGRRGLVRAYGGSLLGDAIRLRQLLLLDLAMDLLVPPLSYLALAAGAGTLASATLAALGIARWAAVIPWAASVGFILAYVGRGLVLSGAGFRGLVDLIAAPAYVAWKVALALRHGKRSQSEWVRTARSSEKTS